MKEYTYIYLLFLISFFQTSCEGQNQTSLIKDNHNSETKPVVISSWPDNNIVTKIRKGIKGTILIASYKGVFRYNGKSFTTLTSKIGSHKFYDALEDRKGNLWLATFDSGVYYYNGKSFQHFSTREGLANNAVLCIYEDRAGIIWFGTGSGLSRYDGKSFRNFKMKGAHWWSNFITTIMEDKKGKLWIATRGYVSIYDGKTFTTLTNKSDKAFDVWSIIEDKKGNIWLGGYDGLRRYDGKTFTNFADHKLYNFIIEDKKGNIWVTGGINASTWALSRYNQKSLYNKKPTTVEIISGQLGVFSGLLEANDGSIWFGHATELYRYDGKSIHIF